MQQKTRGWALMSHDLQSQYENSLRSPIQSIAIAAPSPLSSKDCSGDTREEKRGSELMASSDEHPGATMPAGKGEAPTAGQRLTLESQLVDKGAKMLQSLKPVKQVQQHGCSIAIYSHDMNRQIETHHYITRRNQGFLQAAVYDSDKKHARLIGVEFIVSEKIFEGLSPEEQKLWHSHAYEIKAGVWVNPGIPEKLQMPELRNLAKSYGKFWCTWQVDRGDRLPLGAPALMMSPQAVNLGMVRPDLIKSRDDEYKISSHELKKSRAEIEEPEWINPNADRWKQTGKGYAVDINPAEMQRNAPFP
ncbi:hypothetical protein ACLOJK_010719 [Asimina triloba]